MTGILHEKLLFQISGMHHYQINKGQLVLLRKKPLSHYDFAVQYFSEVHLTKQKKKKKKQ